MHQLGQIKRHPNNHLPATSGKSVDKVWQQQLRSYPTASAVATDTPLVRELPLGPEHTGHFVQPHVAAHCGGDIYSRRKPLFSSFGEHTAVCGSSVRQAVARPRHRQSVCIHNIHVAATCRPSVLGSATKTRPPVAKQSGQCARALTHTIEKK